MTDTRRVCDLSAAELLEAGLAASNLGWTSGSWLVEIYVQAGGVRQARAALATAAPKPASATVTVSRSQLATRADAA